MVLLIVLLVRQAMGWRPSAARAGGGRGRGPPGARTPTPTLAAAVETDVMRLLERARAAAAAGDYRRAVEAAYAALLRKLEGAGLIRVEAHRTNGDYLRDLGERQPALRPRVKQVVAEVERVEFGGDVAGREPVPLGARPGAGAGDRAADGAVLLAAGPAGGVAVGCRPERDSGTTRPSGRSAVREVLRENGLQVTERMSDLAAGDPTTCTRWC